MCIPSLRYTANRFENKFVFRPIEELEERFSLAGFRIVGPIVEAEIRAVAEPNFEEGEALDRGLIQVAIDAGERDLADRLLEAGIRERLGKPTFAQTHMRAHVRLEPLRYRLIGGRKLALLPVWRIAGRQFGQALEDCRARKC